MENDIQTVKIKKSNSLIRIGIKDEFDNDTGEYLQFDVDDMSSALQYQDCVEMHKKNLANFRNQIIIIEKKQDHKGKKLLSANEEAELKALNDFYAKEMEALDLFIGKGKTKTILDIMGRKPYFSMFQDIVEMLEPVMPIIEKGYKDFKNIIQNKYKEKEGNVLE